jgi:signal recognition particle subunit SRP54
MFDNLTRRLSLTFNKLSGKTTLTESMLDDALTEIRSALLESDVSLVVVKKIMADVREKSIGQKIVEKTTPAETIAKIVYDELVSILGTTVPNQTQPKIIMMVGLQGTGKTTTSGKLSLYYKNQGRDVLMASTDIYRPGAREQLEILAKQTAVQSLAIIKNETVPEIIKRIVPNDLTIIDTAGRLQIDDALMDELVLIKNTLKPDEILLTVDATAGQESLNVARIFNERVGITGLVMTRADGDARGGAVLSMLVETGAPVKWVGVGEKMDALEQFYPDRVASRILGMGDVVSLVEKAQNVVTEDEAKDTFKKMMSGEFDLNTMMWQIEKMKKMGSIGGLLKLIPGMGGMVSALKDKVNDKEIDKQLAILRSMTDKERSNPDIIFASRKERIANGSGTTVKDVENLLKRFVQMKQQMKMLGKMPGIGNLDI